MRLDVYLSCPGTCEQAFRFYEQELGGKISTLTSFAKRFAMLRDRFGTSWMLLHGVETGPGA